MAQPKKKPRRRKAERPAEVPPEITEKQRRQLADIYRTLRKIARKKKEKP